MTDEARSAWATGNTAAQTEPDRWFAQRRQPKDDAELSLGPDLEAGKQRIGDATPIGRWVMKTACKQNMRWRRDGLPELSMAVNLSPRQFLDHDLLKNLDTVLA